MRLTDKYMETIAVQKELTVFSREEDHEGRKVSWFSRIPLIHLLAAVSTDRMSLDQKYKNEVILVGLLKTSYQR